MREYSVSILPFSRAIYLQLYLSIFSSLCDHTGNIPSQVFASDYRLPDEIVAVCLYQLEAKESREDRTGHCCSFLLEFVLHLGVDPFVSSEGEAGDLNKIECTAAKETSRPRGCFQEPSMGRLGSWSSSFLK
jgi:hypothetical protein